MPNYNFDCPHCGRAQTVTSTAESTGTVYFSIGETALGKIGIFGAAICCANTDCRQPTVVAHLKRYLLGLNGPQWVEEEPIANVRLIPESSAKPQPDFIPAPLREDYLEACRIKDLSPKASATLSRRCIQGMLRDFAGVSGRSLFDEIAELKRLVDEDKAPSGVSIESVEAIDHVRGIGNIGAHMEKDINIIVSVDPSEAQILVELIESLFEDWYVRREKRRQAFERVKEIATEKGALKRAAIALSPESDPKE